MGEMEKRTPVFVAFIGYELSICFSMCVCVLVLFCFVLEDVFKPMWSLILQKYFIIIIIIVCCLRVTNVVLLLGEVSSKSSCFSSLSDPLFIS